MERKRELQMTIIIILLAVSIFCTKQTVSSREMNVSWAERERHFDVLEREYVQSMEKLLSDSGYANSGITMTSVTEADGTKEYTVLLHHDRFKRLTEQEKEELASMLTPASFTQENIPLNINFYE